MSTDRTGPRPAGTQREPRRTCVGCRRADSRSVLLRVVTVNDEAGRPALVPDPRKRLPGRGAWLHPVIACFELAVRRRAFGRALRCSAPLDPAAIAAYLEHLPHPLSDAQPGSRSDADEHPMSTQR